MPLPPTFPLRRAWLASRFSHLGWALLGSASVWLVGVSARAQTPDPHQAQSISVDRGSTIEVYQGNPPPPVNPPGRVNGPVQPRDNALESARKLSERGRVLLTAKNYREAASLFSSALQVYPNYLPALNGRGIAYRHLGRIDEAIRDYDQILQLNPRDKAATYNRGLAYKDKGDLNAYARDVRAAAALGSELAQQRLPSLPAAPDSPPGILPPAESLSPNPPPPPEVLPPNTGNPDAGAPPAILPPNSGNTDAGAPPPILPPNQGNPDAPPPPAPPPVLPPTPAPAPPPPAPAPNRSPARPAVASSGAWTGTWTVDHDWGTFTLTAQGNRVTGQMTGGWAEGKVSGTVSGATFDGVFQRQGSSHVDGQLHLTMAADRRSFTGNWKWNESGSWAASTLRGTRSNTPARPNAGPDLSAIVGVWYGVGFTVGTIEIKADGTYVFNGNPGGTYKLTPPNKIQFFGNLKAWDDGRAVFQRGNLEFEWKNPDGSINAFNFSKGR